MKFVDYIDRVYNPAVEKFRLQQAEIVINFLRDKIISDLCGPFGRTLPQGDSAP